MKILGIDPGTETTGYGIIDVNKKTIKLIKYGWITTQNGENQGLRLASIFKQTKNIILESGPDIAVIEKLFFFANAKTAMKVSEAIGVLKLAIFQQKIPIEEYAPLKIKSIVTGNGRAKKDLVKKIVRQFFKIKTPKKKKTHFDDAADAIAIALCHAKICLENQKKGRR